MYKNAGDGSGNNPGGAQYVCLFCSERFDSSNDLTAHILLFHGANLSFGSSSKVQEVVVKNRSVADGGSQAVKIHGNPRPHCLSDWGRKGKRSSPTRKPNKSLASFMLSRSPQIRMPTPPQFSLTQRLSGNLVIRDGLQSPTAAAPALPPSSALGRATDHIHDDVDEDDASSKTPPPKSWLHLHMP